MLQHRSTSLPGAFFRLHGRTVQEAELRTCSLTRRWGRQCPSRYSCPCTPCWQPCSSAPTCQLDVCALCGMQLAESGWHWHSGSDCWASRGALRAARQQACPQPGQAHSTIAASPASQSSDTFLPGAHCSQTCFRATARATAVSASLRRSQQAQSGGAGHQLPGGLKWSGTASCKLGGAASQVGAAAGPHCHSSRARLSRLAISAAPLYLVTTAFCTQPALLSDCSWPARAGPAPASYITQIELLLLSSSL